MHVLCVAEKPSISKAITQILSGGQFTTRDSAVPWLKNYDFPYPRTNSTFTVTAVAGHLTAHDFFDTHNKWHSCDPFDLFDAQVKVEIPQNLKAIERNITTEVRNATTLMIWTDCDREGEHIGWEVAEVAKKARRNIVIKRARFSAIIAQQIHNAAQNPVNLDLNQAAAVEARTILDLKIGAAFTRLQTLGLQDRHADLSGQPISYGPCQFPTLGFVVAKWKEAKSFRPEQFWYIYLSYTRGGQETRFNWKRGHLFDSDVALVLYEQVLANPTATVAKVTNKEAKKWKPYPLTTVELQKAGSRLLRLAPKKVLDIAEKLYQKGFLSYPRTETDQFDQQFDFKTLIQKQTVDNDWGAFATSLVQGDGFTKPRQGKKNDQAHPPIHPTAHVGNLTGDDKRVYEFIARRFLACCSKDAIGWSTTIDIGCGGEDFSANGLVVLERNYLDVYPYDKWDGNQIPEFQEQSVFQPSVCELREGQTTKPKLLTEADLVTLMDKNGIGTDATIAQHIQTVVDRDYVVETMEGNTKYLAPSTLGIGLIEGYDQLGLEKSFSKPFLRRETERRMVQVCAGTKSKEEMMQQSIAEYKAFFLTAQAEFNKISQTVLRHITRADDGDDPGGPGGGGPGGGPRGGGGPGRGGGPGGNGPGRSNGGGTGGGPPPPRPPRSRGSGPSESSAPRSRPDAGPSAQITPRPDPPRALPPTTYNPSARPTSNTVQCRCNLPAARRTVVKESASKGKQFWTCAGAVACGFFQFVDDTGPSPPSIIPIKRNQSSRDESSGPAKRCGCDLTAILLTCTKENSNKGRKFWTCPNSQSAKCKFFQWDDETPSVAGTVPAQGDSKPRECFKCGQEGHWANSCPNPRNDEPPTKRRSFSSSRSESKPSGSGSKGNCYKCDQPGHWASDCPGGGSSSGTSRGSTRGRGSGGKRGSGTRGKRGVKKSKFGAAA
ncbi:DNA topoisomerase [Mycena floridula]|nr:DNA topoisomerase [Mycena floridula]